MSTVFSKPIAENDQLLFKNKLDGLFGIYSAKKMSETKRIIKTNKLKRKTIVKNCYNKDIVKNDESTMSPERKKNKWVNNFYMNPNFQECEQCSPPSSSLENINEPSVSEEIENEFNNFFHFKIQNESLAAAVETDAKTRIRKRRLSELKSNEMYNKLSDALDSSKLSEKESDIVYDNSFCFSNHILKTINLPCDCTKSDDPNDVNRNVLNGCIRKISTTIMKLSEDNGDYSFSFNLIKKIRSKLILTKKPQFEDSIRIIMKQMAIDGLSDRKAELELSENLENGKYRLSMPLKLFHDDFKKGEKFRVCRTAFCNVYGISLSVFKRLKKEIKLNIVNSEVSLTNSRRVNVPLDVARKIRKKYKPTKNALTREHFAGMVVPMTTSNAKCIAWMKTHFTSTGDFIPNSATDEIHLELTTIYEIYKEYRRDLKYVFKLDFKDTVSYPTFIKLWDLAFPHVKIRKFKAVTGKCKCCANLSLLRKQSTSLFVRELITELHSLHRSSIFCEKQSYYDRQNDACRHPQQIMSMISDGMNKNHSKVPWYGNLCEFSYPISMHLQCIIEHGQEVVIYRTFENVRQDTNLAIHCFLSQLERRRNRLKKLPEVLYLQYDGGSENANKIFLALCELMVARGIFKEILVSRLPVGHTHEDCDGIFGILWKNSRYQHILTPEQYKKVVIDALGKLSIPAEVVDIYAVPDYVKLLTPCISHHIEFLFSGEDTQHQWKFTKVNVSSDYPFGVKTEYKMYCQDSFYKIVPQVNPSDLLDIGYIPLLVNNEWFGSFEREDPLKANVGIKSNIHFLIDLPFEDIQPAPFVAGVSSGLNRTLNKFNKTYFGDKFTIERNEIKKFVEDLMPQNDDVTNYLCANPELFIIPDIAKEIFADSTINVVDNDIQPVQVSHRTFNGKPIIQVKAAPSVKHSGNRNSVLPMSLVNMDGSPLCLAEAVSSTNNVSTNSNYINTIMSFTDKDCPINERKIKELLSHLQLSTSGTKSELLLRLQQFYRPTIYDSVILKRRSNQRPNPQVSSGEVGDNGVTYTTKTKTELYDILKSRNPPYAISKLKKDEIIDKLVELDNNNIISNSSNNNNNDDKNNNSNGNITSNIEEEQNVGIVVSNEYKGSIDIVQNSDVEEDEDIISDGEISDNNNSTDYFDNESGNEDEL